MQTISTGEPSTLGTYLRLAKIIGNEESINFLRKKIEASPNGESEEVLASEEQMLHIIITMSGKPA